MAAMYGAMINLAAIACLVGFIVGVCWAVTREKK
jgi:hypothetical protein